MNATLRERLKDLVHEALDLPEESRSAFVDRACAADSTLRSELEGLLAGAARSRGARTLGAMDLLLATDNVAIPAQIGRYRTGKIIGEGGMAIVCMAVPDYSPNKHVALKLIRSAVLTPRALRRFRREIEVLSRLEHPGIARLYDAGTENIGGEARPYLVMELVSGSDLITHASNKKLSITERLELVENICDAIQYAHTKGVVHLDIKPSNVMVDDHGRPRVLDFGIAEVITAASGNDPEDAEDDNNHSWPQILGTMGYMSPEQVAGDRARIDTRSDVFSLGVITYQLLTGVLPHPVEGVGTIEALRAVKNIAAPRLRTVSPGVSRDVEAIVGKALELAPAHRYQSASEFAADIRRYLANEPVLVREGEVLYPMLKFGSRHRTAVAVGAFVALALITLVGMYVRDAHEAARVGAEAEAMNRFVLGLIQPKPGESHVFVASRDVLDRMSAGVSTQFASMWSREVDLRMVLAGQYFGRTEYDEAEKQASRAVELLRDHAPLTDQRQVRARLVAAGSLSEGHRTGKASVELAKEALALAQHIPEIDTRERLSIKRLYGETLSRSADPAERDEAIKVARQVLDEYSTLQLTVADYGDFVFAQDALAAMLDRPGNTSNALQEADDIYRNAVRMAREKLPESHPWYSASIGNLGRHLIESDPNEAIRLLDKSHELRKLYLPEDDSQTLWNQHLLARALAAVGRFAEAEKHWKHAIERAEATRTLANVFTADVFTAVPRASYGRFLVDQKRYDEAEFQLLESVAQLTSLRDPDPQYLTQAQESLFCLYTAQNRPDQANAWRPLP